jgi:hypothetical protein
MEHELRLAEKKGRARIPCPCRFCHAGKLLPLSTVELHLKRDGRDPWIRRSMMGEDPVGGWPTVGQYVVHNLNDEVDMAGGGDGMNECNMDIDDFGNPVLDQYHDVEQMFRDAMDLSERIHNDVVQDTTTPRRSQVLVDDPEEPSIRRLEQLYAQASIPVYSGSSVSMISTVVVLLNMCTTHGTSNTFQEELLKYLSTCLLPAGNMLPSSFDQAKNTVHKLGLSYNIIPCCQKGCMLYRNELEQLDTCPKCGTSRYIEGSTTINAKVLRHFPLIPRLRKMYRSLEIANLLKWHYYNHSEEGKISIVADSPAWQHIDKAIDPTFAEEKRNVRLGLSFDGVNPFSMQASSHSTWLVLIVIYNLPPWLATKKFFISLMLLISGKESPTSDNIDVYMELLIEELIELWKGIPAYDASVDGSDHKHFMLRGVLMWTISDFPAYGLISGQQTKGYHGCPCCGPLTDAKRIRGPSGDKIVYMGMRKRLPPNHEYKTNKRFNGLEEHGTAPPHVSSSDVLRYASEREVYLGNGGTPDGREDPVRRTGVKRQSAMYFLPY